MLSALWKRTRLPFLRDGSTKPGVGVGHGNGPRIQIQLPGDLWFQHQPGEWHEQSEQFLRPQWLYGSNQRRQSGLQLRGSALPGFA